MEGFGQAITFRDSIVCVLRRPLLPSLILWFDSFLLRLFLYITTPLVDPHNFTSFEVDIEDYVSILEFE